MVETSMDLPLTKTGVPYNPINAAVPLPDLGTWLMDNSFVPMYHRILWPDGGVSNDEDGVMALEGEITFPCGIEEGFAMPVDYDHAKALGWNQCHVCE